jgi:hypothetical protein
MNTPRIYTYKITFLEVPYYYYGVHKEKFFDEYYMGSPDSDKTKWCWDFYTPEKQILQVFSNDEFGWSDAQKVEYRIIKSVYNSDKWCLNLHCGATMSIEQRSKNAVTTNTQKWQCTVTGIITNPGRLSQIQRSKGIDTSNRIRIQ